MIEIDEEETTGSASWMTTYADLMSLLMCFFVLLLSFSEMDVAKYKQIAGSMREAFGVQNQVKVKHIPKGTSMIAKEFSPGRPNPSPLKTVQQISSNTLSSSLDVRTPQPGTHKRTPDPAAAQDLVKAMQRRETEKAANELKERLKSEIEGGNVEVNFDQNTMTIRIREQGSFPSGSDNLRSDFMHIIPILQSALKDTPGEIAIEGHTDDVPISTAVFRSNWELSSKRALSFAHELLKDPDLDEGRFMIVGYADSKPIHPNTNPANRAENRRVEIVIRRTSQTAEPELKALW